MKKLILLAVLSLVFLSGYSQSKILNSSIDTVYLPINRSIKFPLPDEMFIVKFLMYWDGYVKECFDDSIAYTGSIRSINDTIFLGPSKVPCVLPTYRLYKTFYSHKEPTFEGFMEYLKKITHY